MNPTIALVCALIAATATIFSGVIIVAVMIWRIAVFKTEIIAALNAITEKLGGLGTADKEAEAEHSKTADDLTDLREDYVAFKAQVSVRLGMKPTPVSGTSPATP